MRSVPRGSFQRLSSFESLWRAWHLVSAPDLRDRVLHQSLVAELAPHYERRFITDSYACRPGLGPYRAALRYLGWMRQFRFKVSLDIRGYFQSIDHEVVLDLLGHRLRDPDTLALLRHLILSGGAVYHTPLARRVLVPNTVRVGAGMPVGSCLSQWAANLYLDGLDHFVKRELKVRGYLRYMDDFILFGDDRERLVAARDAVQEWLRAERRLELKSKGGTVVPAAEPATFLGYRMSRAGMSPSRKLRRRLRACVQAAGKRGPEALVRTLRSYVGLLVGPG